MKKIGGGFLIVVLCGFLVMGGLVFDFRFLVAGGQGDFIDQHEIECSLPVVDQEFILPEMASGGGGVIYTPLNLDFARFTLPRRDGMYIHRPSQDELETLEVTNPGSLFYGHLHVDPIIFNYDHFTFAPVRLVRGEWEFTNWISVERRGSHVAEFEMRKILPAGTYGIRMQAYVNGWIIDEISGELVPVEVPARVWSDYGMRWEYVTQVFPIIYAEDLRYFSVTDSGGSNIARTRGRVGEWLTLSVSPNAGAMNKAYDPPQERTSSGFYIGNIISAEQLVGGNFQIAVDRNGVRMAESQWSSFVHRAQGAPRIYVHIPAGLSDGIYTIRVWNISDPAVAGTFILDHSLNLVYRPSDLSGMGTAFLIIGTLFAIAGIIIFLLPKYLFYRQEKQYRTIENKRYMTEGEGAKTDKHFKAQSARDSYRHSKSLADDTLKRTAKSSGFFEAMRASKERREQARDAGLSMEEFKELEMKGKKLEAARATSLQKFRTAVEEKTEQIVSEEPKPQVIANLVKKDSGGVEFDMLDSVKDEQIDKMDMYVPDATMPVEVDTFDVKPEIIDNKVQITNNEEREIVSDKVEFTPFEEVKQEFVPVAEEIRPEVIEEPKPSSLLSRLRNLGE